MKLSLDLKSIPLMETLKKRMSLLLWLFLLLVMMAVGYIVYLEVKKMTQASSDTSGITGQIVRVDLVKHDELTKRMQDYSRFIPQPIQGAETFGAAPSASDED